MAKQRGIAVVDRFHRGGAVGVAVRRRIPEVVTTKSAVDLGVYDLVYGLCLVADGRPLGIDPITVTGACDGLEAVDRMTADRGFGGRSIRFRGNSMRGGSRWTGHQPVGCT